MTAAQLNTALAAAPASCTECNVTVLGTHHDFAILPNGHLVVLADTTEVVSGMARRLRATSLLTWATWKTSAATIPITLLNRLGLE